MAQFNTTESTAEDVQKLSKGTMIYRMLKNTMFWCVVLEKI